MHKILTLALAATPLALAFGQALPPARPGQPAPLGELAADASWRCAQAHIGQASLRPTTTVAHRREMDKYDVKYYKLDLALENNSLDVAGAVWMRARVGRQALTTFAFELYQPAAAGADGLLLDSVVVNGRRSPNILRAGPDATAQLAQPVAAGSLLDARIYYHGTAPSGNSSAIGNALSTGNSYNTDVTWSLSEPFSAHEWFPCKQVLTDKADSSDVWVTTTLPNKAGSNGVLVRTVPLPRNRVRYEWKSRHPIVYYLISVAVAPYLEYVNYANPVGGPRIPVVNYVYNQAALTTYRTEIDRTPGFIENYSRLFGLYPFANEKYGHCMAPLGGGMEHQTMTTQDGFDFQLTAHELCHQWWGDNVTCATWEDISLNESFASYGEYLSLQAFASPQTTPVGWLRAARYYATTFNGNGDRLGGSVRVPDTTNVNRIFNYALTYRKGALVIHMLRYLLNDDVKFFRALRTYQTTYANSTARIGDLQRVFEVEAGRSLTYFFRQWYSGEGFPTFAVRWNQVGGQLALESRQTASMPSVTPFFDTELDYRLTFSNGSTRTLRLRQGQPISRFTVPVAGLTVASIALDPDLWVLTATTNNTTPNSVTRDAALQPLASAARVALPAVAIYPVPCRETLTLSALPAAAVLADVRDALGRTVAQQPLTAARPVLDTRALAPGLYLLRLADAQGQVLGQARFVRE